MMGNIIPCMSEKRIFDNRVYLINGTETELNTFSFREFLG